MNEHGYIRAVHQRLPPEVYRWKICDSFNNEVVDVMYHLEGLRTLWIEYKYIKALPKRPTTIIRPKLSVKQKFWLDSRSEAGLPCVAVVGSPAGGAIYTSSEWRDGIAASEFQRRVLDYESLCSWIYAALRKGWNHDESHDHIPRP